LEKIKIALFDIRTDVQFFNQSYAGTSSDVCFGYVRMCH